MRLLSVPSRQGALWVRRAVATFVRAPAAFAWLLVAFIMAILLLAGLIPVVGVVFILAAPPLLSLGFMIATRRVVNGERSPGLSVFVEPFRAPRGQLLALLELCAAYAALLGLIVWACDAMSGGKLLAMPGASGTVDFAQLMTRARDPAVNRAMLTGTALVTLLSVPFWHAPALIHWYQQGAAQSVFSSTLACWRNRGAFVIYGLALIGLNIVVTWIAVAAIALMDSAAVAVICVLLANILLWSVFYVSLYFTFADSFIDTAGDARTTSPGATL
jgi:hypothetical protein